MRTLFLALAILAAVASEIGVAQPFPAKPVRIIVGSNYVADWLADKL